ncbi:MULTISPECIES: GNAT family N-acetyltransferase [Rhizobium/Agrobacterium group]|uniref:Acetyltransferase (GNAT) family protein n=1 Tax=Rhizobium subbaraonis TaxID=908946 RepID=A0A285U7K0_9HYPH|nr:GNAT family N-acetyltransferase [Agrobacterium tumefaciens]CDN94483.1 Acetyltransferase [Agrobacterium tumefaciens]SOC37910.1 acetyltransferase (GNAT) family protein [Rhizobium subbaraonis]
MGSTAKPVIELLDTARHDRSQFSCGVEALDRYLQSQAGQDARRRVAAPYVLLEPPSTTVIGFYTLSNTSVQSAELPPPLVKKLPRYPTLPATLLGRLAVDAKQRGKAFGTLLLLDALRRCLRSETASLAIIVDAKDDMAASFYERHEFYRLPDQPNRLFKPMAEVEKLFVDSTP